MLIHDVIDGLSRLVYPPQCWVCQKPLDTLAHSLCEPCQREIVQHDRAACPWCAATVGPHTDTTSACLKCRGHSHRFLSVRRLGEYRDGPMQDAILAIKNLSHESLAHILGVLWAEQFRGAFQAEPIHRVMPVPLHWLRRLHRGYNQSGEIASAIAETWNVPCDTRSLIRHRPTPHQVGQSAAARRENVRGAFRLTRFADVRGQRILLIDDVMTTGATVDEATRALLQGGAVAVHVGVIARRM